MMTSTVTGLILIVDDMPSNLDVISEALSDAGFDVAIATSGERALQQIERRPPDLILLDVMMPGIDGFMTCQKIKANPNTEDIPIIFMTALSDIDNKVRALELGAVDYVTKPFHEQEVLARVKTHLQLYNLTRSLESQVAEKTAELQASQLHLIQNEKMSALGNLVAGIAHEINNPVGFLAGNIQYALDYTRTLFQIIELYQQQCPSPGRDLEDLLEESDLEYMQDDLPKLLGSMQQGIDRIRHISTSLRTFARADTDCKQLFDLHEGLDSTLLILQHRLKANEARPTIQIIRDYGDIPLIECFPGQMNQVFMNILANAIDALEESNHGRSFEDITANPNCITIRTEVRNHPEALEHRADHGPAGGASTQPAVLRGPSVVISIEDNGVGMPETVKQRIFDHLFTTKTVGKGTGLGLAITHQIVVEKHGGKLWCDSKPGQGTQFFIEIPGVT